MGYNISQTSGSYHVAEADVPDMPLSGLTMWLDDRSGSDLTDSIGSETGTILTPVFLQASDSSAYIGGNVGEAVELCLNGGSYTYHIKMKMISAIPSSGTPILVLGGGPVVARRGIYFYAHGTPIKSRLMVNDGTNQEIQYFDSGINTLLSGAGIVDLLIQVNYATGLITGGYYNSSGASIGTPLNIDISGMAFNDNNNFSSIRFVSKEIVFENFKKFAEIKTLNQCNDDTYTTDLQIHLPNIISGIDHSDNTIDFQQLSTTPDDITYENMDSWVHDYGYDMYQDGDPGSDGILCTVPRRVNGDVVTIDRGVGTATRGYRIVAENDGSGICNTKDAKIRFSHSFFDRSDTDIWAAAARSASDYDAANTKDFHMDNLSQRTLMSWLNVGYRGRLFVKWPDNSIEKWDRKYLSEVLLYDTDKTGSDHSLVLTYTGDIIAAILDGSAYDYDANNQIQLGTLQATEPMITMRFDDTRDTHLSFWLPMLQGYGINKAVTGCHASQVGELVGKVNLLSWADTLTLYNAGWEIACHNSEDNDYTGSGEITLVDTIDTNFALAVSLQESENMECEHYIGNRYSMQNPSVPYHAHKIGFKTAMAWGGCLWNGIYPYGPNPIAIDLFNLWALNVDILVDDTPADDLYYLSQDPNATQIQNFKDAIDLAVSENRWLIIMKHGTTVSDEIEEIIQYAQTKAITFVTPTEAIANTAYL